MIWQTRPERWKSAETATESSGKSIERRWRSLVYAARLSREGNGMRTRVTISPGFLRLFQMPSARKKSFRPTSRRPSDPASSTVAPRVMSTGGVSAECAATHFFPTRVTWQTSPSFFRQYPRASRQNSVWL